MENTNEINNIEVEVENENIGVNPYQFKPYDSDSSSCQTQDSNSDESDHDRLENTDWQVYILGKLCTIVQNVNRLKHVHEEKCHKKSVHNLKKKWGEL